MPATRTGVALDVEPPSPSCPAAPDLATDEGAAAVAGAAGNVDILVNNAGQYLHGGWLDVPPRQWADLYQTNMISAVRMIQHLVPAMRAQRWGRVITIGGGLGIQPEAAMPDYNATLAARHNLAVSLARDLRGSGVTSKSPDRGCFFAGVPGTRKNRELDRPVEARFLPR